MQTRKAKTHFLGTALGPMKSTAPSWVTPKLSVQAQNIRILEKVLNSLSNMWWLFLAWLV